MTNKIPEALNHTIPLTDHSAFKRRLHSRRQVIKSFEAKANSSRTVTEKIADFMTSKLGSMMFLFTNSLLFLFWILINTNKIPAIKQFDPYPFGFLTMMVSLEAIFLSIIVLMSQNRASKIDDIRDEIDLHITTIAEEEITKIMELQVMILKKQGIDISTDKELQQMLEPVDTNRIEKELEKQLE